MANPQEQKAIDKTEVTAHQINNLVKDARQMCHCLVCRTDRPPPIYGEDQVLHHIKAGLCRDGTFKATSKCGAEISLQMDSDDALILIIEGKDPSHPYRGWWKLLR